MAIGKLPKVVIDCHDGDRLAELHAALSLVQPGSGEAR